MRFMIDALEHEDPFMSPVTVPDDVRSAIEWQAARSAEEVCRERRQILDACVAKAAWLRCVEPGRCGVPPPLSRGVCCPALH